MDVGCKEKSSDNSTRNAVESWCESFITAARPEEKERTVMPIDDNYNMQYAIEHYLRNTL